MICLFRVSFDHSPYYSQLYKCSLLSPNHSLAISVAQPNLLVCWYYNSNKIQISPIERFNMDVRRFDTVVFGVCWRWCVLFFHNISSFVFFLLVRLFLWQCWKRCITTYERKSFIFISFVLRVYVCMFVLIPFFTS